ncbi:hypothetical protein [Teredinibacter sp. KSP-S5-2]|uniref:hypothetical protein n=1 Tax=Teredinibacter sp. KSP-S5-2 TaxID=3034506 RepID=UPI002934B6FC|nr:hypothetical protein [Teredinibacter sp. KSP-S5-2]WNO08423.1 hypothetical protein P5V12_15745 [Teredinibacter sp. KSP-S5-2]
MRSRVPNPLHQAILNHDHETTRQLLQDGADIQATTQNGRNALQLAEFAQNLPAMIMIGGEQFQHKAPPEVCRQAIKQGLYRLEQFTETQRTPECCQQALLKDKNSYKHIPSQFLNPATLAQWCQQEPKLITHLPTQLLEQKEFYKPVLQQGYLTSFPKPWLDIWIDEAVSQTPHILEYLVEDQRTYSRCLAAVTQNGYCLRHVPLRHRDHTLCLAAVSTAPVIAEVPEHIRDQAVYLAACQSEIGFDEENFSLLPQEYRTYPVCLKSIKQDYMNIEFVPQQHISVELCCAALEGREFMGFQLNDFFRYVPEELINEVQQKANFIYHVQPGEFDL